MSDVQERVLRHALFVYTDPDRGSRRVAYRGDTVRVAGEDLERGERLGVFVPEGENLEPVAAPEQPPVEEPEDAGDDSESEDEVSDEEPPAKVAAKAVWVDYRVAQFGEEHRDALEDLTKGDLQDDGKVAAAVQPSPPAQD